jgi:hypothetical protein
MSTREQRGYQMIPVLDGARVETALRFASGLELHFAPGGAAQPLLVRWFQRICRHSFSNWLFFNRLKPSTA